VNPSRGLQVPLSPSSGSSVLGDAQDRDLIAAAGNQPGHYSEDFGPSSPTHAARVNQLAKEDNINPYTALPLDARNISDDTHFTAGQTTTVGLGGAALGAAGLQAYHNQDKYITPLPTNPQELEALAAQEATTIAAPDSNQRQAALESSIISAPDAISPPLSASNAMSGGRSAGDLTEQPMHTEIRPATEPHHSQYSISQLHVPGEYPKSKDGKAN